MLSWIGAVLINGLAVVITLVVLAAALFGAMHKGFEKRGPNRAKILEAFGVKSDEEQERAVLVGFFHPYCNAGGGGERVLWTAIAAIQQHSKLLRAHSQAKRVYTGDTDATSEAILRRAQQRFNLKIDSSRVVIIHLQRRDWVEARRYPVFTLLGQSLGSLVLGYEALSRVVPDIFIDSMGYAFTYPLVRYFTRGSVPLLAYVHYPTISTDMLERVQAGQTGVESHRSLAGRHPLLGFAKSLYYRLFAAAYGWAGSFAHIALTNSTWTRNHIDQLWHATRLTTAKSSTVGVGGASRGSGGQLITTVYPPCPTEAFSALPLGNRQREIVSVAQFRPEKNHPLQVEAFAKLLRRHRHDPDYANIKLLVLIGSSRNIEDQMRVDNLRQQCDSLGIADHVEFVINADFKVLVRRMGEAMIGIHTMRDEHFGIGIVELMAAGLVTIAHNSGGPKSDIITTKPVGSSTGYLAETCDEYVKAMETALALSDDERNALTARARKDAAERFSEEVFNRGFLRNYTALAECLNA
ncbi:hypothetical protein GQ42DRAFT_175244 [Ramicandelaber brevisporus]|nr:hypothetical protein GQ42DRAFT_175244 [Ramicandelaber brevisporus]